jgi:uroporphyrinogen decarboxylase
MTPKERFLAALRLEAPDRLPLMYQHLGGADHLQAATGYTLKQGYSDPSVFAELSLASHKLFGFDNVMAGWGDLLMEASAFGTGLRFTNDRQYPREELMPIDRIDEVSEIDPLSHPQWSVMLKAARLMNERAGTEVLVLGCSSSPFIVAGSVLGYENLLVAQMTQPEMAHKLLRKITASQTTYIEELADFSGLEAVFVSDASADAEQNALALSEEFDIAYTKTIIGAAQKAGLEVIVHNCSESPYSVEELEAYRPSAIHLAARWRGLPGMVERLRGSCGLVAGIDHRTLIYRAAPDEIMAETERVAKDLGDVPGLILAPACELAFDTPIDNILAFKEAVHSIKPA